MKACELLRRNANRETRTPRTVGELVDHYRLKEMSDTSAKSFSRKTAYECYLRNKIVPVWGKHSLSDTRPSPLKGGSLIVLSERYEGEAREHHTHLVHACMPPRVVGTQSDQLGAAEYEACGIA